MLTQIESIVETSLNEILLTHTETSGDLNAKQLTIYGENGVLDSISLVSLILLIEEKIQDEFNCEILLANEKAMSQVNSPFNNYHSLTHFIHTLLTEKNYAETSYAH